MIFDYYNFIASTIQAIGFGFVCALLWSLFFSFVRW